MCVFVACSGIVFIQVSDLCDGEWPTSADVFLYTVPNGALVDMVSLDTLPIVSGSLLSIKNLLTVEEDMRYTVIVSYSNLQGDFDTNSSVHFSKG